MIQGSYSKDTYTMFTAALFTIAKTWKQSKCSMNKEDGWYKHAHAHSHTHTGILLSHKKNEIMPSVQQGWTYAVSY